MNSAPPSFRRGRRFLQGTNALVVLALDEADDNDTPNPSAPTKTPSTPAPSEKERLDELAQKVARLEAKVAVDAAVVDAAVAKG